MEYRMNEGRNANYKFNIYDKETNAVLLTGYASGSNKTDAEKDMKMQARKAKLYSPLDDIVKVKFQMIALTEEEKNKMKRNVKDIMAQYGYNQKRLSERFSIPYRTIQNWANGQRECPPYILKMMDELLSKERESIK